MFHIERKSLTCPNTTIYGYTNRYTNGVPHWGTPCFKVTRKFDRELLQYFCATYHSTNVKKILQTNLKEL